MVRSGQNRSQRVNCVAVEAQLIAYLKDGLGPTEAEAVRAHLLDCERCSEAVQEARALDSALYAAAPSRQPALPPRFSEKVQADVYRRMRRALVVQRTRDLGGRAATIVVTALFLVALALFMEPWLRYLATVEAVPTPAQVAQPAPTIAGVRATAVPFAVEGVVATPAPLPRTEGGVPVEYQSPADGARSLLEAAIAGDQRKVRALLIATRARAPRVWARLEACQGTLEAGELRYTTIRYRSRFAGVRVHYGEQFAGEMKLLLRGDGRWYLHYLNYASFSSLGDGCLGSRR